jgi:hypothetical protein
VAQQNTRRLLAVIFSLVIAAQAISSAQALTNAPSEPQEKSPSGTLLLPLTPKLDLPRAQDVDSHSSEKDGNDIDRVLSGQSEPENQKENEQASSGETTDVVKPGPSNIMPERGNLDEEEAANSTTSTDDVTLKGTIQIVADDTEYDQEKNTFLGTGNAVAIIAGQDSKLEADMILYDQNSQMIDARGNVRILRGGQLSTGTSFKFNVTSDEYLITNPDTELQGTTVVARKGFGSKSGLSFRSGTMSMPTPFYLNKNAFWGPVSYGEIVGQKLAHPEAYVPPKQSFKFKAHKMVYERYKEQGNLTVFGGRMMFGEFGIPLPKFTASIGKENGRVVFPITPTITNNLQMGGINVGPSFNYAVGKEGKLTWTPMVQFGGRNLAGSGSNSNSIGLSGQVAYSNRRMSAHIAAGSVSNLVVADFKYAIRGGLRFQSGINRFLDDGMFGFRRARLMAELVDNHPLRVQIPLLSGVIFRTSAGWAQDNPQLINVTSNYAKLFNTTNSTNTTTTVKKQPSAFRLQEQIQASSQPLFVVGNQKYGVRSYIYGGLGLRRYSSGQSMLMAQAGPVLDVHLDRIRVQTSYTQSTVRGKSPFVFDQFIQGQRSAYVTGDYRINKYLTIGGTIAYNLDAKLAYGKTLNAVIGPEDFKLLLSREFLTGQNRFGFDVLYGHPIPFDKLVLKGRPDQGQLGGI